MVGAGGYDSVPSVRANLPLSRGNTTASCCQGQPPVREVEVGKMGELATGVSS